MMNMKLKVKITLPIMLIFVIVLTTYAYIYYSLNIELDAIWEVEDKLETIGITISEIYSNAKSGILSRNSEYSIKMAKDSLNVFEGIKELEEHMPNEASKLRKMYIDTYAKIVSVNSLFIENRVEEGNQRLLEIEENYLQIRDFLWEIVDGNIKQHNASMRNINIFFVLSGVLFLGVIAIIVGIIIPQNILKPIHRIKEDIKSIADGEGDLTKKLIINSKDEMGELASEFNRFIDVQAILIKSIFDKSIVLDESSNKLMASSSQIAKVSEEVARTIEEIAKGASEQAEDTQKATESTEDMGRCKW